MSPGVLLRDCSSAIGELRPVDMPIDRQTRSTCRPFSPLIRPVPKAEIWQATARHRFRPPTHLREVPMSRSVRLHEFGGPDVPENRGRRRARSWLPGGSPARKSHRLESKRSSDPVRQVPPSSQRCRRNSAWRPPGVIEAVGSGVEGFVVGDRVRGHSRRFDSCLLWRGSLLRRRGRSSKSLMTRTGRKRRPPGWRSARLGAGADQHWPAHGGSDRIDYGGIEQHGSFRDPDSPKRSARFQLL